MQRVSCYVGRLRLAVQVDTSGSAGRQHSALQTNTAGSAGRQHPALQVDISGSAGRQNPALQVDISGSASRQHPALQANTAGSAGRQHPALQVDISGSAGRQKPALQVDNFRCCIFEQHHNVSLKSSSPGVYYCEISGSNNYDYADYVSVSSVKMHQVLKHGLDTQLQGKNLAKLGLLYCDT